MRRSCLLCVKKHLGQAIVLFSESRKGYPSHKWVGLGHLAEAEDECLCEYPELAKRIRGIRLQYEDDVCSDFLLDVIEDIMELERDGGFVDNA